MGAYGPPAGFYRNKPHVRIDYAYCTGCLACTSACPQSNALGIAGTSPHARPFVECDESCAGCGACVRACPTNAIGLYLTSRTERT